MSVFKRFQRSWFYGLLATAAVLGNAEAVRAQEPSPVPTGVASPRVGGMMTREERIRMHEQMATAHRAVADCLRSGRSMEECRQVMADACPMCQEMMGGGGYGCPMMGAGSSANSGTGGWRDGGASSNG